MIHKYITLVILSIILKMEHQVQNFIDYLQKLGIANSASKKEIVKVYTNILESAKQNANISNIDFKEAMCATLIYYFSSLNDDSKKTISLNLIINYYSYLKTQRLSKLKSSLLLLSLKNKQPLTKYFLKWKYSKKGYSIYNPIQKKRLHNQSFSNYMFNSSNTLQNATTQDENNNSMNRPYHLETSWDRKERQEFEECTFKPVTNYSKGHASLHSYNTINTSVYDRLYKDGEKYAAKKQMKAIELDHLISEKYNFTPELIATPKKFRRKSQTKFDERQQSFILNKSKHQEQIQTQVDDDYNTKCSFSPTINKIKKYNQRSISPAHIRLYEDDKNRRNKNMRIKTEYNQKIDEQCYSFVSKRSTNPNVNSTVSNNSMNYDSKKIEELYNQYKAKSGRIEKIKKNMEKEGGITFQPYVYKDNKYYGKINTNVYERGEKLLENKAQFVNLFNQAQNQNWKERQIGYKEYSQQEKEQITKRIIDRLYGQGLEDKHHVIRNPKSSSGSVELHSEQVASSQEIINSDDIRRDDEDYQNEGEVLNSNTEQNYEENEDDKYNDKIISIDEYTFGKNKKKKLEIETGLSENKKYINENYVHTNQSQGNGSYEDLYTKIQP